MYNEMHGFMSIVHEKYESIYLDEVDEVKNIGKMED